MSLWSTKHLRPLFCQYSKGKIYGVTFVDNATKAIFMEVILGVRMIEEILSYIRLKPQENLDILSKWLKFSNLSVDRKIAVAVLVDELRRKEKPEMKDFVAYPIDQLNASEQRHIVNLIKVANKSTAHLMIQTSSEAELESLGYARQIIFRMMIDYVDGLVTSGLWWKTSR